MKKILFIGLMILFSACDMQINKFDMPEGSLLSVIGHYLSEYNFSTDDWTQILDDEKAQYHSLTNFDDKSILISDYSSKMILKIDIVDGKTTEICKGHTPLYLKKLEKLVFYTSLSDKAETALYIADYGDIETTKKFIDMTLPYTIKPVFISDKEFLYMKESFGVSSVWKYNAITDEKEELHSLKNCELSTLGWNGNTQELFCTERPKVGAFDTRYFLSDLYGKRKSHINFGDFRGRIKPIIYLSQYDVIVLLEGGFEWFPPWKAGEVSYLWLYDMKTEKKYKISKNFGIGQSAVWFSDNH